MFIYGLNSDFSIIRSTERWSGGLDVGLLKFHSSIYLSIYLYILPYALADILDRLRCHAKGNLKPEDHWSCIAHLSAEDMLKSAVIEEKRFKNIESE